MSLEDINVDDNTTSYELERKCRRLKYAIFYNELDANVSHTDANEAVKKITKLQKKKQ